MIRLVLSDLDDTLIPFGSPCASSHTLEAIHALQDAGVHFAPCSGRPMEFLHDMFAGDDEAWSTAILVNGQEIRLDGRVAFVKQLGFASLVELGRFASGFACTGLVVMIDGREVAIGVDEGMVRDNPDVFVSRPSVLPELPQGTYVKAIMYVGGGKGQLEHVCARCRERFPEFSFILPTAGEPVIDVMPQGWSKAKGAEVLCDLLGVRADEVCVFGDAANDLPIFERFTHTVAVANATPEVLATARYTIGSCADDAVADALFQIACVARSGGMPAFMQ